MDISVYMLNIDKLCLTILIFLPHAHLLMKGFSNWMYNLQLFA